MGNLICLRSNGYFGIFQSRAKGVLTLFDTSGTAPTASSTLGRGQATQVKLHHVGFIIHLMCICVAQLSKFCNRGNVKGTV
jgi:hypothetical protein